MKLAIALLFLLAPASQAQEGHLIPNPLRNIPKWVRAEMNERHFEDRYTVTYQRYPITLKGNFDGDGRKDIAIQVEEKKSGKQGFAIFHPRKPQAVNAHVSVLGAGNVVGSAVDDFRKVTKWSSLRDGALNSERRHPPVATIKSDLIKLETSDSTISYIYWNGKQHVFYPAGR